MSRTIVYSSPFVPAEWIAAHGFRPLRLVPDVAPAVSQGVCPFAAAFAQSVIARDDAAVLTTTCDQMRRISEPIASKSSVPLFLMNVPATWQTATARDIYKDELLRMSRWMIANGGARQTPLPRYSGGGPGWGPAPRPAPAAIPIALVGGPLRRQDQWIRNYVSACGGDIALDATEEGDRAASGEIDAARFASDPVEELTRAYFDAIPDAFRRPDTLLHEYLRRELRQRNIRGILLVRFLWCDHWHAQLGRLRESTRLPIVEIDLGGEDHSIQRTRNRIEALLNILK